MGGISGGEVVWGEFECIILGAIPCGCPAFWDFKITFLCAGQPQGIAPTLISNFFMKNILFYISIFIFFLFLNSCEKGFEDLNKNPEFPTQTDIGPLFNFVIQSTQLGGDEQLFMHNEVIYPISQQGALTAETFQNTPRGTEDIWTRYYTSLANVRELEKRFDEYEGEQEATNNVRAMVKIMLAYQTFRVTDLFGDIPFFAAGKAFQSLEFLEPKYDSQESIYKFLLDELKWANDNLNTSSDPQTTSGEAYLSFGNFDNIFNAAGSNGNASVLLWKKFANSLRLRYALRMVEKDASFANPILQDVLENDLPLIEPGEDVGLYPRDLDWEKTSTHYSFHEHKKLRMGSTIWNMMSENDNIDGSGIFDPRAHIFFESNNANEWVAFPQIPDANTTVAGGIPYQGHRDVNYSTKGADNIYSPFNYYLIRDRFDVPEMMMTAAEVNFLKAEIYFRGLGVAVDEGEARAQYTTGVVNSIKFWQDIFQNTSIWENKPAVLSSGEIFSVTNHPQISIFNSNDQLNLIYAQRWMDAFRQPWEAYALLRRTQATPREGAIPDYYRFAYPSTEIQNNADNWAEQVGRMGEDSPEVKVWWMNW